MSRSIWFGSMAAVALLAMLYLFVSCISAPPNPYDPSNTKIYLTLESSTGVISADTLTDSVGNTIKVGITANLPSYVDSIGLIFYSSEGNVEIDTILTNLFLLKNNDTLWYKTSFTTKDKSTLIATVFAGQHKNSTYGYFNILNKPIPHTWPHLVITGTINITAAQTCSLSITALDSNAVQLHSFYVKQDTLPFTQFTPPFKWMPPAGFISSHPVTFKVTDTDSPAYFDTQTVMITVSDTSTGPHWASKTLSLSGAEGSTLSLTLTDISTGDSLSYILMPGLPAKDTIINAVYSYAFVAFDTNNYYPKIIAKDKKGNADTMTVHLWASRTNIDSIPPVVKHLNPPTDSITVSSNSYKVLVICKDTSGIASVKCSSGADTFPTMRADSVWSATITGLVQGQYKTVTFLATDMSARANKTALNVYIKYDSTITDTLPPVIMLVNPSKDTIINTDSSIVRVKCTDANGISSVIYSIGSQKFTATRSTPTDSIFTGTVKGLAPGAYSTITITATDASTARNTATAMVKIKYDNDRTKPTVSLFDPAKDSLPINANSYAVKVVSKDSSGVASVVYTFGMTNYPATKTSDSVWTGTVSGLASGAFNKITVVATDASINANKDTMSFFIKYDPTMTDLTGPVFFPKSGPANNAIVVDSSVSIVDSIYDPSGVDSVYWTQNGKNPKLLMLVSGSTYLYSLVDTLHRYHLDTIVIFAQDKSTNRNKSSQTIILNYNVPPVINDTAVSTNRNIVKTWTLNALSVDGDPLTWTRLSSPSALSGTVTGTLPSVTFTPAANWSGADSFKVQVTDGHWSDTAKIKITVVNVNVAPSIVTQPSSATKNVGQSVTFSVAINADVNPAPSFVWKQNGNIITTATTSSYTIGSIALSDSGSYTVTIANTAGTVTSQPVTLTVNYAPIIERQPQSLQIAKIGDSISLSVTAIGSPAPKFQWFKNGTAFTGKTDSILLIKNIQRGDSATYYVSVTNSVQNILSHDAIINVRYVVSVFAGSSIFFFTNDGTLWGCGSNWIGQIGDGTKNNVLKAKQIMPDVVSVSNNAYNSLMLKKDGSLWGCGDNSFGQLGDTLTNSYLTPKQVIIGPIIAFSSGANRTFYAINSFGLYTLWSCGKNYSGALGNGTLNDSKTFAQVPNLTDISSVCAGFGNSAFILTNSGILWAWGDNSHGQLGDSTFSDKLTPEQVMTNVAAVTSGQWHTVILGTNGTLYGFGDNSFGQLGSLPQTNVKIPTQIPGMTGIIEVSAGNMHTLILKNDNSLWACGSNGDGEIGDSTKNTPSIPKNVGTNVIAISGGINLSTFIKADGTLWGCGNIFVSDSATYSGPTLIPKRIF